MASFSQTYTNNTSVTIPAFAESISVTVAASSGGGGGNDAQYIGGSGGFGRVGTFTLPNSIGRTLTFSMSGPGSNGVSSQSNASGGSGGGGVASGGTGGRAGPGGSSGGGGGGGGATGVYDSYSNSWIIVAGGGGGGGGAAYPNVPGLDGNAGQGWGGSSGTVPTISSGGTGGSCPTDGSGGGGGGGGASGGNGGNNGYDVSAGNVRAGGGGGGGSGYRSSAITWTGASSLNSGNGYVTLTYTLPAPSINSFTASANPIVNGNSTTLSWNVTGNITSVSIDQGIGGVSAVDSRVVAPSSTRNYTLTATGPGGTSSQLITVTVYQPPQTAISVDNASIIRGSCTTLRWVTTGDASSATITPGIGAVNINGLQTVCPTETVTYQINVSGLGGSASSSVTLTVYQPPTVSLSGPESLNYGEYAVLSYEATYADIRLEIIPSYNYSTGTVTGSFISLPPGPSVSGIIQVEIPYNDFGPFSVDYGIVATGNGGRESKQITIPIVIDQTPTNFLVPESTDLFKDQDPIYTPEVTITSLEIVVDDIDIPVEIKADRPILVEVNNDEQWTPLRPI